MAKCETCGDTVSVSYDSVRVIRRGKTKYYCSKKCMNSKKKSKKKRK